jgi:hypothetical protein
MKDIREPLKGEHFRHKERIYKTLSISRATSEILLEDIEDGSHFLTSYATFKVGFERVLKVGDLAKILGRHTRSIYRYEAKGVIQKPKMYNHKNIRMVRFYTIDEVVDIHETISQLHQGRPRKDKRVVNNTLMDAGTLRSILRERFG